MHYILVSLFVLSSINLVIGSNNVLDRFNEWVEKHNFKFKSNNHILHILGNWLSNDEYINNINLKNLPFRLGHNAYSGYSLNEFSDLMSFDSNKNSFNNIQGIEDFYLNNSNKLLSLPSSVDWRDQNLVNPVKDQGQCGSCWSFSTIQALESASAIKYGKLYSLSEQQLVDCDNLQNGGKDHGCNGGLMDNAFTWISKNNGVCSELDYPYISGTTKTSSTCKKCTNQPNTDVIKFIDIQQKSDLALMTVLAEQPVSIAIEADQRAFQLYASGVFTETCGTTLDHGVGLVGYGTLNGVEYYILRNSWGTTWGLNGYMLIGRGNDPKTGKTYNNGAGQCGLLMEASYPVV